MDPTMAIFLDHSSDLLSHLSRKGLSLIVWREMGHGRCVQIFNIIGVCVSLGCVCVCVCVCVGGGGI